MPERRSHKIDVTPEAHMAAKVHCALRGINIKDYVTDLILKDADNRTIELMSQNKDELSDNNPQTDENDSNKTKLSDSNHLSNISFDHSFKEDKRLIKSIPSKLPECGDINPKLLNSDQENSEQNDSERSKMMLIKASPTACEIYSLLSNSAEKAITIEEITSELPNLSKPAAQTALYWLLRGFLIQRRLRENPDDKRKNSWVYWKTKSSVILKRRGVDIDNLLEVIPEHPEQAISVKELATNLELPLSTVRDALKQLEFEGKIASIYGANHKSQPTIRYYRLSISRKAVADRSKTQAAYLVANIT